MKSRKNFKFSILRPAPDSQPKLLPKPLQMLPKLSQSSFKIRKNAPPMKKPFHSTSNSLHKFDFSKSSQALNTSLALMPPGSILLNRSESSSSSDSEQQEQNKALALESLDTLLTEFCDRQSRPIIKESIKDIIAASLIIFSNSLLDNYIRQALEDIVKYVVVAAIDEMKNIEYIDICEAYIEEIIHSEATYASDCSALEAIIEGIYGSVVYQLFFQNIAKEAIFEENWSNKEVYYVIAEGYIEILLTEDWLEMLVEDEVCVMKVNENYKLLPLKIQKEISLRTMKHKLDLVVESIYFDMLNDYVGSLWTENVVNDCVLGNAREDSEDLMPTRLYVRGSKRFATMMMPYMTLNFTSQYKK